MQKIASGEIELEVKYQEFLGAYDPRSETILFDFDYGVDVFDEEMNREGGQSPALGFWAESYHAYLDLIDDQVINNFKGKREEKVDQEEDYVHIIKESQVIDKLKEKDNTNNETKRKTYDSAKVDKEKPRDNVKSTGN